MPLTLQEILQIEHGNVDVGNDTLFSRKEKLSVNKERLTLVISSGGSGASAIKEAYRIAKQKLHADFDTYMKFIMVDSDADEIRKVEDEFGKGTIKTVNISTPGAAARFAYETREEFYRQFLPVNFKNNEIDGHGSGQVRLNGKAKFYDRASQGQGGKYNDTRFREIIESFYQGIWAAYKDLDIDIMILSGLAGGNGSGTFEELAAHARYACRKYCTGEVRVFGYLFLPDTMQGRINGDMRTLYINGYAALKELESYTSLPFNSERTEIFRGHDAATNEIRIECKESEKLFDYPILISGDYEETKTMMAESIVNLACKSEGDFNQNQFYSNMPTKRKDYLASQDMINRGLLRADVFPEDSHYYAGIGYAYAAIPNEVVTANVVSNVSKKLYEKTDDVTEAGGSEIYFCTDEKRMSKTEMETQIRKLFGFPNGAVKASSLWEHKIKDALKKASKLPDNQGVLEKKDIINGNIEAYRKGYKEGECVTNGKKEFEDIFKEIIKSFVEHTKEVMVDYGPHAMEFLYEGTGPVNEKGVTETYTDLSIRSMLDFAKGEMQKIKQKQVEEPPYGAKKGLKAIIDFFTKSSVEEWKGEFRDAVQHSVKQQIIDGALESGGVWEKQLKELEDYFAQCKRFAESLESLKDFYHSEGMALDSSSVGEFVNASQVKNCVNLCNNAEAYAWVKQKVSATIKKVEMAKVRRELISSFVKNPSVWTSDVVGETRKEFDRIMAECCGLGVAADEGSALTVTAYFNHVLDNIADGMLKVKARETIARIVQPLLEKSKPSLHKRQGSYCYINRFILIPKALTTAAFGAEVISAFKAEMAERGVSPESLAISPSVPEIVCYQTSVANGLCDLEDIAGWEKAYSESEADDKWGRHLINGEPQYAGTYCERTKSELANIQLTPEEDIIFGTGLSLENYPPVALHNLQNNRKEQKYLEEVFNPIVDYALEEKIIERRTDSNTYKHKYVINLIPQGWKNLDVEDYDTIGHDGKYKRGETLFRYLKEQNRSVVGTYQKVIRLEGSGHMGEEYDFTSALDLVPGMTDEGIDEISIAYMKRKLRKNTALFLELRETLCRYYDIAKELEYREKEQNYIYLVKQFLQYYQFGLIFEKEDDGKWYYLKKADGTKATLSGFGFSDQRAYSDLEKKLLEKGWKFLLAYKKFEEKALLEELNNLLDAMIEENPEDMEALSQRNLLKLYEIKEFIKKNVMDTKPEDMEEKDGIVRAFKKMGAPVDEYYVKILYAIWKQLPTPIPVPVPTPTETEGDKWKCPKCGNMYPNSLEACPIHPEEKNPNIKSRDSWKCPKCGNTYPNSLETCPIHPEEKNPNIRLKDSWKCPKCGNTYPNSLEVCPIHPEERNPNIRLKDSWKCPKCGNTYPNSLAVCPIHPEEKNPNVSKPDSWKCPKCGNTYPNSLATCPLHPDVINPNM